MRKSFLPLFAAALILVVAPALAQTAQCQNQDKPTCTKDKQQCAQPCSKEGKSCTATCPDCGKTFTATCSKDGKSCTGTCPNCNKTVTIPCPSGAEGKHDCCADGQKQAAAGCAKEGQSSCAASTCSGQMMRYKNASIPVMLFDVAGERIGCPKTAVATAAEKNCAVKYVVDDKVYEDKAEALKAQADLLDKYLDTVLSVQYAVGDDVTCCPQTAAAKAKECGKPVCYRMTGYTFKDQTSAEVAAKNARTAADALKMEIAVGDKKFDCPVEAAEAAKQCGQEVDYCVGTMRTTSEIVAKIQLDLEKIKAAIDKIEESGGKPI